MFRIKYDQIKYILVYLLSGIMVGLLDLITVGFDPARLLTAGFWTNVILTMTAAVLVRNNATNQWIGRLVHANEKIEQKEEAIDKIVLNDVKSDFDEYIGEENLERKKKAYIKTIDRQIEKLRKKASKKDLEIAASNNQEAKERNKYWRRLNELNESKSSEFIEKNLLYLSVDYKFITPSTITNDYTLESQDTVLVDGKKKRFKDTVPGYIYSLFYAVFMASIFVESPAFDLVLIFNFVTKLIILIPNYIAGSNYAHQYVKEVIIVNLDRRLEFLKKYLTWRATRKDVTPYETTQLHD